MADSTPAGRPSSRVLPHELPPSLREAASNWIREPLDDAVDRRRRIIMPPPAAVMGTPADAYHDALAAEARHPDTVFVMGDNPALPAMPERPTPAGLLPAAVRHLLAEPPAAERQAGAAQRA